MKGFMNARQALYQLGYILGQKIWSFSCSKVRIYSYLRELPYSQVYG